MNWMGIANWLVSGVLWAAGTTIAGFQIVPDMKWSSALALAGTTFVSALVQHLREHPFTPPTKAA